MKAVKWACRETSLFASFKFEGDVMSAMQAKRVENVLEDMGFEINGSYPLLEPEQVNLGYESSQSICRVYNHNQQQGVRVLFNDECSLLRVKCDSEDGPFLMDFEPGDIENFRMKIEEMVDLG